MCYSHHPVSASSSSPHSSCPKRGQPRPSQMDIRVCGFLAHKTPKSLYATDKAHISESGVKNLPRLGLSLLICPLACHETHYWSARLHTEWTGEATEVHRTLARLSDKEERETDARYNTHLWSTQRSPGFRCRAWTTDCSSQSLWGLCKPNHILGAQGVVPCSKALENTARERRIWRQTLVMFQTTIQIGRSK